MARSVSHLKATLSFIAFSLLKLGSGEPATAETTGVAGDPVAASPSGEARASLPEDRNGDDNSTAEWPQWANDRLGYWPLHDRGGGLSEYAGPGDRGMLGVLARIELNEEDGKKLDSGLPAHPLRPKPSRS